MKKALLAFLPFMLVLLLGQNASSQCHALFTWEQIPGTLQIHFHSTSTSEHDITSYSWTFGDGGTSDGQNPYHTYDQPGTYTVCLIIHDSEGCVSDVCHQVTVNAGSDDCEAAFTWTQTPGTLTIVFDNNSSSEHDIISNSWNFGDTHIGDGENPSHTYSEPGTYVVCLVITDNVGCSSDVCHEVHVEAVQPPCHAGFTWDQVGNSLEVDFTNTSTSPNDIISYQWIFGDGSTGDGQNPSHIYDEPGTYVVCLIIHDSEGCASDVCHEVHVEGEEAECHAEFNWEQLQDSLAIHFHNQATSNHDIISYSWNFGDGSLGDGPNPYHVYDEPGTYVVCLLIEDNAGCASDICHEVHVEGAGEPCHADFNWEQIPGSLQIHYHSTSTSEHDIISYLWTFGDGHSGDGQNPYHTYDEPGTYVVCLRIEDNTGCVSEICHEVHIEGGSGEDCHADFNWEQIPGTLQIHYHSTSTSEHDIVSYSWNFGDGSFGDGQNPYHTYDVAGTYTVCLLITDASGCVSDICHEVHIEGSSPCHAAFDWEQLQDSLALHFHNHATSEHDIISYIWTFGDGSTGDGPNPYHTYDQPGTYVVCLRIEDNVGCVSEICHEVHVEGEGEEGCHASFNWDQIGNSLVVQFINTSTSNHDIISYSWNFGDGHTGDGQNPMHTYEQPGTYVVCLVITDASGCASDVCHEVHIEGEGEACHADFTWEQIPGTLQIHFNSTSTSNHDIISYSWNFGDGHFGDGHSPYHTYDEPGTYTVCLLITDNTGCVSDICHEITVGQPECDAAFSYEISDNGVVHFNNNSTGTTPHTDWYWTFGDGGVSDNENPEHLYDEPGMYTVCLVISDTTIDCQDTFCVTIPYAMGIQMAGYEALGAPLVKDFSVKAKEETFNIIQYTNPAGDQLIIDYDMNVSSPVLFELHDMTGYRMISEKTGILGVGKQQQVVDISRLHSGMYILTVTTATARKTMSLTVAR